MPTLPRDIAIFIDGTWDRARPGKSTNVRKLFEATQSGHHRGREQLKWYTPGVGSKPKTEGEGLIDLEYEAHMALYFDSEMPRGLRVARPVIGGAFGRGTSARIQAAYHVICDNFDRHRGDRLFIFGFSRGAFAARSLSGFIEKVGLLLRDHLEHVQEAYELYESGEDASQSRLAEFLYRLTGHRFANNDSPGFLPIHLLGVWDTVGSLGLPSRHQWLTAPFTEFHQVEVPPNVMHARHGLALHELRRDFEPLLWKDDGHPSLEQVWFPGAHGDVGGGYATEESGLSDAALMWMAAEAAALGLALDRGHPWLTPSAKASEVHHQIRGMFAASIPTVRAWLRMSEAADDDICHFHSSTRDYLAKKVRPIYSSRHPYVRAALRKVDELAVPRMVVSLRLGRRIV
jgi:uncharacterized protein (DUF2235 family)